MIEQTRFSVPQDQHADHRFELDAGGTPPAPCPSGGVGGPVSAPWSA